jgi:hypothetical protein
VKFMRNQHRLRNTFVLGAVGAGMGATIGAGISQPPCTPDPTGNPFLCVVSRIGRCEEAALIGAIGFVGGAVVGGPRNHLPRGKKMNPYTLRSAGTFAGVADANLFAGGLE